MAGGGRCRLLGGPFSAQRYPKGEGSNFEATGRVAQGKPQGELRSEGWGHEPSPLMGQNLCPSVMQHDGKWQETSGRSRRGQW